MNVIMKLLFIALLINVIQHSAIGNVYVLPDLIRSLNNLEYTLEEQCHLQKIEADIGSKKIQKLEQTSKYIEDEFQDLRNIIEDVNKEFYILKSQNQKVKVEVEVLRGDVYQKEKQIKEELRQLNTFVRNEIQKLRNDFNIKKDAVEPGRQGYTCVDGFNCFKYNENAEITWAAAKRSCELEGARLAIIKDSSYNQLLSKHRTRDNYSFWIGLMQNGPSTYTWIDGSTLGGFSPWKDAEASDAHQYDNENCIGLTGTDGSWWDWSCNDKGYFICEIPSLR